MSPTDALLREASKDGIDFGGLRVSPSQKGYEFRTPEKRLDGLDEYGLREAAAGDPWVRDWYFWERDVEGHDTARRAFLRWLEQADEHSPPEREEAVTDGIHREWGELTIEVGLAGHAGQRIYEVRHADNRETPLDDLDSFHDPLAARDLVKHDDKGRYRPLSTAPSLPHGFAFVGLDGAELVRTVDFIYPATIANWHREREGKLDVTHYRETAERQTGIYDMIESLPRERVETLAATCCVDSQCLKQRAWDESPSEQLDVPRGDGEFPCREPCSLVVAAARQFAVLEGETTREYSFELTPSEKNQLEAFIEAVADGRVDEIREADLGDPANRYRARALRSKRMEDGDLCGIPTIDSD